LNCRTDSPDEYLVPDMIRSCLEVSTRLLYVIRYTLYVIRYTLYDARSTENMFCYIALVILTTLNLNSNDICKSLKSWRYVTLPSRPPGLKKILVFSFPNTRIFFYNFLNCDTSLASWLLAQLPKVVIAKKPDVTLNPQLEDLHTIFIAKMSLKLSFKLFKQH
jgi:hypothetical protein